MFFNIPHRDSFIYDEPPIMIIETDKNHITNMSENVSLRYGVQQNVALLPFLHVVCCEESKEIKLVSSAGYDQFMYDHHCSLFFNHSPHPTCHGWSWKFGRP